MTFCEIRDDLVSIAHVMIVCGILGELQTFTKDIDRHNTHLIDSLLIVTIVTVSQLSLLLNHDANELLLISSALLFVATLQFGFLTYQRYLSHRAYEHSFHRHHPSYHQDHQQEDSSAQNEHHSILLFPEEIGLFTIRKYLYIWFSFSLFCFLIITTSFLFLSWIATPKDSLS
jgi:hypothetical protein